MDMTNSPNLQTMSECSGNTTVCPVCGDKVCTTCGTTVE